MLSARHLYKLMATTGIEKRSFWGLVGGEISVRPPANDYDGEGQQEKDRGAPVRAVMAPDNKKAEPHTEKPKFPTVPAELRLEDLPEGAFSLYIVGAGPDGADVHYTLDKAGDRLVPSFPKSRSEDPSNPS